ncbi:MAG TPA: hypothetical protein VKQ72_10915 [Aggregatilineales bacterium]|nr:hypothetical protein [Aggregatilineales bacterium]
MIHTVQRSSRFFPFLAVVALLLTSVTLVNAQTGGQLPKSSPSCNCQLVKQALTLLGNYGIKGPEADKALQGLVPLLNNEEALQKRLVELVGKDKAQAMLQDPNVQALIDKALKAGVVPSEKTLGDQANALLANYGITDPNALSQLLPLLGDNDLLRTKLQELGLKDPAQIDALLNDAAPLIQQGLDSGLIQNFVVQEAQSIFDNYKIPQDKLDEFLALKGDPAKVAAFLKDSGLSADQQAAFEKDIAPDTSLGLNTNALDYDLGQKAIGLLGDYGLKPSALGELIPLLKDPTALMSKLGDLGLDPAKAQELLGKAGPLIQEGLSSGAVDRFMAQQTQDLMDRLGIPEDQVQAFADASKDPAAMQTFLDGYGITGGDVAQAQQDMQEEADSGVPTQDVQQVEQQQQTEEQNVAQGGQQSSDQNGQSN